MDHIALNVEYVTCRVRGVLPAFGIRRVCRLVIYLELVFRGPPLWFDSVLWLMCVIHS